MTENKLPLQQNEYSDPQNYRLKVISEIQTEIEGNRDDRRRLKKIYGKALSLINSTDTVLTTTSVGLGVAGVGLLSTIIAAPIVLGMEIAALGLGVGSLLIKYISKALSLKVEKHQKILSLTECKLNTIQTHISKAIEDGNITEDEFKLILEERQKFIDMREELRSTFRKQEANTLAEVEKETN
jgi:hypothetical protein